jgi:hypothetical protein
LILVRELSVRSAAWATPGDDHDTHGKNGHSRCIDADRILIEEREVEGFGFDRRRRAIELDNHTHEAGSNASDIFKMPRAGKG